jgi:hypothetical protein
MRWTIPTLFLALPMAVAAQQPWQQMTTPATREVAANFQTPPREYGAIHWAIWGGPLTEERITTEFDALSQMGMYVVNFGPARGMTPKYLSPEHLALTKFAVAEARKRGMKVWLADEGSYPSGFAGGRISEEYPQLTMQGIVADVHVSIAPGQTIAMPVPVDTLAAMAVNMPAPPRPAPAAMGPAMGVSATPGGPVGPPEGTALTLPIVDGQIKWTAPPDGHWEIQFIRHVFRSSPTRYINRADGTYSKDSLYSLIDYLNPDATKAFLKSTHEVYKGLFGDEFGSTVIGFFADEPDYTGFKPWTPTLLEQFREKKGYDLQPYLPLLFAPKMTDEAWRVKADYWDVWSGIFSNSFFGVLGDWARQNHLEYLVHLNHEELMLNLSRGEDLIRNEGDFFRDMRHIEVPGVDNLSQLLPAMVNADDPTYSINNNFPKLASSAAHLFGRPRVWTEEGGGLGIDGKFQVDYQLVEGFTALQLQGALGRSGMNGAAGPIPVSPAFSMLAWYTNRAGYLMSIGRPAAQVALYHPANSMWLGDEDADRSTTKLSKQLLEHQIDFDYFDEQSLRSVATLEKDGFRNLSGQLYRAVIVPSSVVITRASLDRLRSFASTGGKVIFIGSTPSMVVDRTFLHPDAAPDLSFAMHEASGDLTPTVIADLPKPDFVLDQPSPLIRYNHRAWRDADLYFIFNESNEEQVRTATVLGHGRAQVWDLAAGQIHPMLDATAQGDLVQLPLVLEPYEARLIVIGPLPANASAPEPVLASRKLVQELDGDWSLSVNGQSFTAPLKSWQDLGVKDVSSPGTYTKVFNLSAKPAGKRRILLECADLRDYAHLRLNGVDLQARGWQPYRWDVTKALKPGRNVVEIEVRAVPPGRGPAPAPPSPAAGTRPQPAVNQPNRPASPAPVAGMLGPVRIVSSE